MIGGTTQLLAEALVLAERNGLERAKLLEVIAGSAIGSPYVELQAGDAAVRRLHLDLHRAAAAQGSRPGAARPDTTRSVPLPVTALVQQLVEACIAQGMGDLDLAVLVPRLERSAGGRP